MSDTHPCLVCGSTMTPVYRAFCEGCFPFIPWELRADVMLAYRLRVRDARRYQEALIALREWAIRDRAFTEE